MKSTARNEVTVRDLGMTIDAELESSKTVGSPQITRQLFIVSKRTKNCVVLDYDKAIWYTDLCFVPLSTYDELAAGHAVNPTSNLEAEA
jgi:hypothetical protein